MSVVNVTEKRTSRSGSETLEGFTHSRAFQVEVDATTDTSATVLAHADLPALYAFLDSAKTLWAVARRATVRSEDGLHWDVTVDYAPVKRDSTSWNFVTPEAPWDIPPSVRFGFAQYERGLERAYKSTKLTKYSATSEKDDTDDAVGLPTKPIQNSANDPFDPPITQEQSRIVIRITRNERATDYDPNVAADLIDSINAEKVTIGGIALERWQARLRAIDADPQWTSTGQQYYAVQYEIETNRETFVRRVLDQGFYKKDGTSKVEIKLNGKELTEPAKLDGMDGILAGGFEYQVGYDPVYLHFLTYQAKDWTALDLPKDYRS